MSLPNLIALTFFFTPRRIAKFAGFRGGRRRARQEPQVRLACAAAGLVAASTVALLTVLHLTAFKEMPR